LFGLPDESVWYKMRGVEEEEHLLKEPPSSVAL
jgi:hypothetical protein